MDKKLGSTEHTHNALQLKTDTKGLKQVNNQDKLKTKKSQNLVIGNGYVQKCAGKHSP